MVVSNNTIAVTVADGVELLDKWTSTDPEKAILGDKPWIALDIDIGTDDITQFKRDGRQLTSQDVQEAEDWGLEAGHILLWIDAEESIKTFTLSGNGYKSATITVTVADAA